MEYVIELLERERKSLERGVRDQDLMHKNMNQATLQLKYINELKRAVKILKGKSTANIR
ncbi:hypothetical protein [Sphingobacterium sp. SYP-B4668]|uniref:hypothetical protein n=1 Tax=Sphingobacterium sp. SYP-B4668 TaxID=2996035 RepID=UPI0012E00BB8|nr:hypothetical protein [Sphingobacterium sp. SYP-B4668]